MSAPLPDRFETLGTLGRGAFGELLLAHDRARDMRVAVKRLHRSDPAARRRFKQEFRGLAELRHQNLVALYELLVTDEPWLLTMEPIDGQELGAFAGRSTKKWRAALPQISDGLAALHAAGHLHRDIAARNVMVADDGRVVILDFGLLGVMGEGEGPIGTLQGISPEMLTQGPLGPAADWYAVGAMLYEGLSGSAPFPGRGAEVVAAKVRGRRPPSVKLVAPETPPDLAALVDGLLAPDPEARLQAARDAGLKVWEPHQRLPFLGRRAELERLEAAYRRAAAGARLHVRVRGPSGIGKSALLARFASQHPHALTSRCFEHEATTFAGVDPIVDRLLATGGLETLPREDAIALGVLFPQAGTGPSSAALDRGESLRRAARALSSLARAHADAMPPLWIIDDAQWGDDDGGWLLARLSAPAMLLVTVERCNPQEAAQRSRRGDAFEALDATWPPDEMMTLGPLSVHDLTPVASIEESRRLHRETDGSPLLIEASLRGEGARSVAEAMEERIARLRPPERALLATLSVAARPLPRELAFDATDRLGAGAAFDGLTGLRGARLVEIVHVDTGDRLELVHPSVAEAGRRLTETQAIHAALDDAMRVFAVDDPETHARHAFGAGHVRRAAALYERAAERAAQTLAFERSTRLWRRAIELGASEPGRAWANLAESLSALGRNSEAAEAFEEARALGDRTDEALALGRRRAEEWLSAGEIDRGERALIEVLAQAGEPYPGVVRAFATLFFGVLTERPREALRRRGRPNGRSSPVSADVCYSAGRVLANVDSLRAAFYFHRSLELALRLGDPVRIARSAAYVAASSAGAGPPGAARTARLIAVAERAADGVDDPLVRGLIMAARSLDAFHAGDHGRSLPLAVEAESTLRLAPTASRERVTFQIYQCANLSALGRWETLESERERLLEDARARRDRFTITNAGTGMLNLALLVRDRPDLARSEAESVMRDWGGRGFHVQHFFDLLAQVRIDLYEGRPDRALERTLRARPRVRRSLLSRLYFVRVHLAELEGRARLARLAHGAGERGDPARIRATVALLRREGGFAREYADAIEGALHAFEGRRAEALEGLTRARDAFARRSVLGLARAIDASVAALGGEAKLAPDPFVENPERLARALGVSVPR